jgi:general secretion pathway protein G
MTWEKYTMLKETGTSPRNSRGFTLIELLVVLMILGLLAGVVGPRVMKYMGGAKTKTAILQIAELGAGLDLFHLEVGRYPTTDEGLLALGSRPSGVDNWHGPYLKKRHIPPDPWGVNYQYRSPGENSDYDLFTLGRDNTDGGDGENADILSW